MFIEQDPLDPLTFLITDEPSTLAMPVIPTAKARALWQYASPNEEPVVGDATPVGRCTGLESSSAHPLHVGSLDDAQTSAPTTGHTELVRRAYERFNDGDLHGVLDHFDEDLEFWDHLRPGVIINGRDSLRRLWTLRYAQARFGAMVGRIQESNGLVTADVRYQAYAPDATPVGRPLHVMNRFSFRQGRISRLEANVCGQLDDEVRDLFLTNVG